VVLALQVLPANLASPRQQSYPRQPTNLFTAIR
jgi:hypothetical protein